MARKDVELVIRAKDEAAKAVNAVTTAINSLVDAQSDLKKSAGASDSALGKLGAALAELDKNLRGATVGAQISKSLDNATKAADRLEKSVAGTAAELADLQKRSVDAAAATDKLKASATTAAVAVEREAAALAKSKAAVADQSATIRTATADRQKLIDAEARLGAQVTEQQGKLDAAIQRYQRLGDEIAKTANPTKTLTNSFEAAGTAVDKQESKLNELKVTLGTVRAAIDQTGNVIGRLNGEFARVSSSVAKQEGALAGAKQEYVELQAAVRSASQNQRTLAQAAEGAADSLEAQQAALDRAQTEMGQLSVAAGKADAAMSELAAGATQKLQTEFNAVRRAMLETRREWVQSEAAVKELAGSMERIGPPTREQAIAWNQATTASRAAKAEYLAQRDGLNKLSAIVKETGGDVDVLRERFTRFAAVQGQTGGALAKIRTEASASVAAYQKLAGAADQATKSVRGVGTGGGTPPAGPVNSLADAWRRVYGESRQALSITQRLRGEVLSLIAAYGGLYGVINVLGQAVTAYQTLEAAQSRLNAVFRDNPEQAGQELDFIRRNADRLGISFGQLADEYTKFAAATKGTSLEGEKTRKIFIFVSEAARVNKLSFEDLQGVFRALTQIASKGRVQLEELSGQLGDRLPGALQIMADGLGVTTQELLAMTKQGEVTADGLVGFAEELDRRFGSALASSLKTTTTAIGQMQNAAYQALITFAKAGFIESFTNLIRDLTEVMQSADFTAFIQRLSGAISILLDAIGLLVKNFQLVTAAAAGFAAIKIIPFIVALGQEYTKLRAVMTAAAASFAVTNTAMAASTGAAGTAAVAFGRLAIAFRLLLSSTGIGLALTAISVAIGYWATQADTATEALVSHEKTVDAVKNAYDKAAGSADKFAEEIKSISAAKVRADLVDLNKALEDIAKPKGIIALPNMPNFDVYDGVNKATKAFNDGTISLAEYSKRLDELAKNGGENQEWLDEFIRGNLDLAKGVEEARQKVAEAEATIALLKDPTDEAAMAVLGLNKALGGSGDAAVDGSAKLKTYEESIDKLKEKVPELAEELKKLKELAAIDEAYKAAIDSAMSIGQANEAFALRQKAIDGVNQADYDAAAKGLANFTDGLEASAALIRKRESFIATPKWDVNALRVGFGSDTVTLADGSVKKVVDGMRVSVADANRDLVRRIGEFQDTIKRQIGGDTFGAMNPQQQAALTSIAYNYGSLPDRIVKAIMGGGNVADAIRGLGGDNGGINRNRRNEEAAVFSSGSSPEAIEQQVKTQADADAKALDIAKKKTEEAEKFHEAQAANIEQQQFELTNQQQDIVNREVQKALREAELEAKRRGTELTEEERQKIIEVTTAKYQQAAAEEAVNQKKTAAAEAEQRVNDLLTQQKELQAQLAIYKQEGDTAKVTETETALTEVNTQLQAAIANAQQMWAAVGGTGADTAISKLKTAALEGKNLAQSGQQSYLDWGRVGQLFASGLTNAFDQFAQAVANGEDVGDAARDAFLKFASDFLRQIAQMIIQQAILNALRSFGLGGGGAGGVVGGLFHRGGVVGAGGGQTRRVNPAIFAGAERYHDGGVPGLKPGEVPAILQKNEEVLTGDDPRNILNGGATPGASQRAQDIKVVNAIDSGSFIDAGLNSKVGEKAILNFIRANSSAVKSALG